MPFVTVKMLDGRTPEQKKQLVRAITDVVVDICGAKPEGTMVVIEDIARDHWSRGGVMISDQ
jgi:4-oxalocrotonate tautomerase